MYKIEITNKKTKQVVVYDNLTDANKGEKLFFKFQLDTTNLEDGEYVLSLYEEGVLILADTLHVGNFSQNAIQYTKGENIYVETLLDTKTEDRQVEINEVTVTIYPSEGNDAMTSVTVDASNVYNDGYESGYDNGKEDGIVEGISQQKDKLESITVTENGVYEKEDGYNKITVNVEDVNGSYDEGYEDGYEDGIGKGGEAIIEETQVLNITENGSYSTDYTKVDDLVDGELISGLFDDGTPFYGYTQLTDMCYYTGIKPNKKIEIWWKPDGNYIPDTNNSQTYGILGEELCPLQIYVRRESGGNVLAARVGKQHLYCTDVPYKWNHLVLTTEGFWVNGEKIGEFDGNVIGYSVTAYINGNRTNYVSWERANGYYGMVKIDDNIIIPTDNGYINYTTNTPLTVYNEGEYVYNEKTPFEGNLIRTVNVNITPKISAQEYGLRFGYSKFATVPEWVDLNGITDATNLFYNCTALTSVPFFDVSKIKSADSMFYRCSILTTIPQLDFGELTNTYNMFYGCSKLDNVPLFDTSKVYTAESMFYDCTSLTSIPQFDFSSITIAKSMFYNTSSLQSVPLLDFGNVTTITRFFSYSDNNSITDLGGFKNLKIDWNDNYGLYRTPNLTHESIMNVITNLYDFRGNGDTTTTKTLKLNAKSMALLSDDDKAIATNKGWTLTT